MSASPETGIEVSGALFATVGFTALFLSMFLLGISTKNSPNG